LRNYFVDFIYDHLVKSFQISCLQLFEMINELFADTVVISHHEKLFNSHLIHATGGLIFA